MADIGIKVSVFTTTYNHERFIAQAVEGVLAQVVDFEYEHVIGEDCSTDLTRDILLEYQKLHADRIRLLLREQNIGRRHNFLDTFWACRGDYVAILEGDDYWTSPHKLQKQADFLDSHPECALCFHPVIKYYEDKNHQKPFTPSPIKEIYTLDDLLERNFIATCSVMFRNRLFDDFPPWFQTVPAGDLPLHVLNAQHGDIGYIDEVMAVHRIHSGGVWSPRRAVDRLQAKITILDTLKQHLGPAYEDRLNHMIARLHMRVMRTLARDKNLRAIPSYAWDLLSQGCVPKRSLAQAAIGELGRQARGEQ